MLCMKCFRDTSAEARRYCVDLDTAYNQGAKKLERALTVSEDEKIIFSQEHLDYKVKIRLAPHFQLFVRLPNGCQLPNAKGNYWACDKNRTWFIGLDPN